MAALPALAQAAELDGASLALWWAVPFAGLLLSIALMPLLLPSIWHHHFGKITTAWALAFLVPLVLMHGAGAAAVSFVHALLAEYLPFVILLTALYVVAGGIYIRGSLTGTPVLNTAILALGAVLASFMGTTGASMLLIRPLIRANAHRSKVVHIVVFFIFIVSNAGGSLTPLGDPPLFLGFLKGVDFSWTLLHIWPQALFLIGALLALFFVLDCWMARGDVAVAQPAQAAREPLGFDGKLNFALLGAVVGLVLLSGMWKSAVAFDILGTEVGLPGLVRDIGLIGVALLSLALTPKQVHADNQFGWAHAGGRQAVRRHLPDHHPRHRHAQGRCGRSVRCRRACGDQP